MGSANRLREVERAGQVSHETIEIGVNRVHQIDLEACLTFVQTNRMIAEIFREKAGEALLTIEKLEDSDAKQKMSRIVDLAIERAVLHEDTAIQQQLDLGTKCYCPVGAASYVQ